jgi:hypothetical protein
MEIFDFRFSIFDWVLPRRRGCERMGAGVVVVVVGRVVMWLRGAGRPVIWQSKIENRKSKIIAFPFRDAGRLAG